MGILLSTSSALEYWRHCDGVAPQAARRQPPFGSPASLTLLRPHAAEIHELDSRAFPYLSRPVHLLVPHQNMKISLEEATVHVMQTTLPASSYVALRHDVFVAGPELTLASLAASLSMPELIQLGCELCGSYRMTPDGGFRTTQPATCVAALRSFGRRIDGARGVSRFRRAVRYVLDGSASPMETAVALMLALPPSLGGYGLPAPVLNRRIEPRPGMQTPIGLTGKRFFVADLCWPGSHYVLEYDSDAYHTGPERIAADAARRDALQLMGYDVSTVSRRQAMSALEMNAIAQLVAKKLGVQIRLRCRDWNQRNFELRETVLPPHKPFV